MNEQKLINKQLVKSMLLNIIAFTVIFTVFSFTIYTTLQTFLYQATNQELLREKERYVGKLQSIVREDDKVSTMPVKIGRNPRVIQIQRNENGEIINKTSIGIFYDDYINEIKFDKNNLNTIHDIKINNQYTYRTLTFEVQDNNGELNYIQLLISVDSESRILENFLNILSIGTVITIVLSILASYILSKKSMEPVVRSMKKQTEFVQNASHELRTPLTIIQAKQELLLQEPEAKIIDKAEEITLTLNETKRLAKLTKDLMVLARSDSNTMNIQREKVDIDNMIEEITKPYIEIANMQNKEIKLLLNFKQNIWIDRNKIHQVLVILLDNAIKYTEENDKIEITTEAKEGKCIIEVKDTGIGINDEAIKHIFERFYREDKARSRESGGSGLGLAIADCIIEAHKGTIQASHNSPKGTIFTVKIQR